LAVTSRTGASSRLEDVEEEERNSVIMRALDATINEYSRLMNGGCERI
jgi:hypothetical protein